MTTGGRDTTTAYVSTIMGDGGTTTDGGRTATDTGDMAADGGARRAEDYKRLGAPRATLNYSKIQKRTQLFHDSLSIEEKKIITCRRDSPKSIVHMS